MEDELSRTPPKQKVANLCEQSLDEEEDSWENWEDAEGLELATTPVKEIASAASPTVTKVYDAGYLLQFRKQMPNPKVAAFFPEPKRPEPAPKVVEKPERDFRDSRGYSNRKYEERVPPSERPFANIGMTADQRLVVLDNNQDNDKQFFGGAAARPLFGQNSGPGGRGGHRDSRGNAERAQRNFARLDNRASDAFKVSAPDSEVALAIKNVQGLLNKITPEKYQAVFEAVIEALMQFNLYDTEDQEAMYVLDAVIGLVFEKALSEPAYCNMYADVARHLCMVATAGGSDEAQTTPKLLQHFRKMLLDRCQTEFEQKLVIPDGADELERQRLDKRFRKRGVGNIRFIAELFKRTLLTEKIMHEVIQNLLLGPTPYQEDHIPSPEELEVLCKLLSAAGKLLDRPEAKEYMNYYFELLHRIRDQITDNRVGFMITDIIELRDMAWNPRREETQAKKLSELDNDKKRGSKRREEEAAAADEASIEATIEALRGRYANRNNKGGKGRKSKSKSPPLLVNTKNSKGNGASNPGSPCTPISPSSSPGSMPVDCPVPGTKGRQGSKNKRESGSKSKKGQGAAPAVKEYSAEEMDNKAKWLVGEYADSQNTEEYLECMSSLGGINHPLFVARATYWVIESLKLKNERVVLPCMLDIWLRSAVDRPAAKQIKEAIEKGIQLAFKDVLDFELWADSPFLWRNWCDYLLELVGKGVVALDVLNDFLPQQFYTEFPDEAQAFVVELFSQLKAKDIEWLTCTTFYRLVSLVDKKAMPELLETLKEKELLDTDLSLYLLHAISTDSISTDTLSTMKGKISEEHNTTCKAVIVAKIAAAFLAYLTGKVAEKTAAGEAVTDLEVSVVAKVKDICKHFIASSDTEAEVQGQVILLNEVHRSCVNSGFPKGHMLRTFKALFRARVCSQFAFEDWMEGDEAIPDKGKAIFEVNTFIQQVKAGDDNAEG